MDVAFEIFFSSDLVLGLYFSHFTLGTYEANSTNSELRYKAVNKRDTASLVQHTRRKRILLSGRYVLLIFYKSHIVSA